MRNKQSTALEGSTKGRKLPKKPEHEIVGKKTCKCTFLQCTDWTPVLGQYRCAASTGRSIYAFNNCQLQIVTSEISQHIF